MVKVNVKMSAGKTSGLLNFCNFFMTDQVEKENVQIEYFSTDKIWGYFMTKPAQGEKIRNFIK